MFSTKQVLKPKPQGKPQQQPQPQQKQTTWVKHHKKRNYTITAVIVAVLIGLIVFASLPHPKVNVGDQAPSFTLQDVNSQSSFHLSDLGGKPVMIEFMRTTCEYCQQEAPVLAQLFTGTRVTFVSISIDPFGDSPSVLQGWAMNHHSMGNQTHPWYWLRDDTSNTVMNQYGINGTPTMFMVNTHGIVQARIDGFKDLQTLQQSLMTIS